MMWNLKGDNFVKPLQRLDGAGQTSGANAALSPVK